MKDRGTRISIRGWPAKKYSKKTSVRFVEIKSVEQAFNIVCYKGMTNSWSHIFCNDVSTRWYINVLNIVPAILYTFDHMLVWNKIAVYIPIRYITQNLLRLYTSWTLWKNLPPQWVIIDKISRLIKNYNLWD